MLIIKRFLTRSKFVTRIRFLLIAAISIASILLLSYYLRRTESRSASSFSRQNAPPSNNKELPQEIGTLPPSAFVIPTWKKPPGHGFWPGIRQPPIQSAEEADLEDDAEVIGIQVQGRARAYCVAALSGDPMYKVVNDVLAGRPVTVAYCDLTRCARVFTTPSGSAPLKIGIGGWNADKGLMLYHGGVNYALADGQNLRSPQEAPFPYQQMERERTTWGEWRRTHPETDAYVLPPDELSFREKGYWPGIRQPQTRSAEEAGLDEDAEVVGVCVRGRARAYWIDALSGGPEFHVVNDVLAGRPVTVAYCDETHCARVFTKVTGSAPLDINVAGWDEDKGMMLYVDGVKYALKDGKNVTHPDGPSMPYQRMEYERMTWEQWRKNHPDTDVYVFPPNSSVE